MERLPLQSLRCFRLLLFHFDWTERLLQQCPCLFQATAFACAGVESAMPDFVKALGKHVLQEPMQKGEGRHAGGLSVSCGEGHTVRGYLLQSRIRNGDSVDVAPEITLMWRTT